MGGEAGNIRFSGERYTRLDGTYNKDTKTISDLRLFDAQGVRIQGNLTEAEMKDFQARLANTTGADTTATKEKIADKADTTTTKTTNVKAPEAYTTSGRYTEAKTDADLREGFKGDKIKAEQQRLKDQGYLTDEVGKDGKTKDAVDGFWGPKTQAAYERFQADQKQIKSSDPTAKKDDTTATKKDDATTTSKKDVAPDGVKDLRTESDARTKYQPVTDPKETTKELVQDIKAGNVDDINKTLTNTRNADMKKIDANMPRDKDGNYTTPLADVDGNDSDYADLGNRMLKGERFEGNDAAANSKLTDQLADKLARSTYQSGMGWAPSWMNGTNENMMNEVFSKGSGAQLAELDRRLKNEGIKDSDGNVIKNKEGLRGLVNDEIGDGAHKKLLLDQLNRPLN